MFTIYEKYLEENKSRLSEGANDVLNRKLDEDNFMNHSEEVLGYLMSDHGLFSKPYNAMIPTELENGYTFLSINADKVSTLNKQTNSISKEEKQ